MEVECTSMPCTVVESGKGKCDYYVLPECKDGKILIPLTQALKEKREGRIVLK